MAAQKAFIDGVIDYLDPLRRNLKQLLYFIPREIRHCKNSRRPGENPFGCLKINRTPEAALLARARHVFEHVVHRHDVWTRQRPWYGKKIGNVYQVAIQPLQGRTELAISVKRPLGRE